MIFDGSENEERDFEELLSAAWMAQSIRWCAPPLKCDLQAAATTRQATGSEGDAQ